MKVEPKTGYKVRHKIGSKGKRKVKTWQKASQFKNTAKEKTTRIIVRKQKER